MATREIVYLSLSAKAAISFYETMANLVRRSRVSLTILNGFNWKGSGIDHLVARTSPCLHIQVTGEENAVNSFFAAAFQEKIDGRQVLQEICPHNHTSNADPDWLAKVKERVQQMR